MSPEVQATTVDATEDGRNLDALSFEELLEVFDYDQPRRGETLKGLILEVNDEQVILDVGTKRDAIVPRRDLERLDQSTLDKLVPGTELLVYVLKPNTSDGELLVSINKALTMEDWDKAQELSEADDVIDVTVIGANKGGVLVSFGRLRGFVPNSQLASVPRGASSDRLANIKDKLVGEELKVKVIEVNQRRNRLVMSETAARRSVREEILTTLEVGQVISGKVVGLADYGAFVDIGDGVHGLIHISKLDWQHLNHPSEVLKVGDDIEARIDHIDVERDRISLNRQATIPDPWAQVAMNMKESDLITGTISSVVEYGIFLDLPNGVTGLAHVSEMTSFNIQDPRKWAQDGDELLVRIISIDVERKRIGLSIDAVDEAELTEWMLKRGKTLEPQAVEEDVVDGSVDLEPELEAEVAE